jgi:DNA replication and repair protein RecF
MPDMKILQLEMTNFRNHSKASFNLNEDLILITGKNGAGKTNILEAIYLLSGAKSLRCRYDRDLIQFDKSFAIIKGDVETKEDKTSIELQIIANPAFEHTSTKKAKINKVPKTIAALTGTFSAVLFTPQDLNILIGPPSDRRKLMDSILSVAFREYKRSLDNYTKAIRQRNKLLEQILETGNGQDQLEYWTQNILKDGIFIQNKRKELIDFFNERINTKVKQLNGVKRIKYDMNEMSQERLNKYAEREILARSTLVGPHRDDIKILADEKDLAEYGSRGQQREVMFAIRLCEIDFFEHTKREKPVLLLDDIFSEFDKIHQEMVIEIIADYQTIISNTDTPGFINPSTFTISLN